MATSLQDLIKKVKSDVSQTVNPIVQKYNQLNSTYQKVNNPNVGQIYNQLPQRLEPVRRTYNQVQRPVGNTLATLGTVGQSAYQGTRRIVEPLGYSFGTAVRSPWEQSQINRQKQTSQQTSQRLYNQALQARQQGNPELARRLTVQAQGQFTPVINRQRQLGVDQSRFTKPQMVSSTLKTGASALAGSAGLGSLLATSALGGGLSAGIAKWQGQDPTQAFGTGIAEALPYAFVNKITDPVYGQIANRVLGQAANPLAKIFAKGGTYGLANLVENEITTRMFEGRGATGMEQVFAGGMGVGYGAGSQAFRELKNVDFSEIAKKFKTTPEVVKQVYNSTLARKVSWVEPDGTTKSVITDKQGAGDWIAHLEGQGKKWNVELTNSSIGAVGKVNPAPKPPTDPTEAKDLVSFVLKNKDVVDSVSKNGVYKITTNDGRVVVIGERSQIQRLGNALGDDVTDVIYASVGRGKSGKAKSGDARLILDSQDDLIRLKHAVYGKMSQPEKVWDHVPVGATLNPDGKSFTWHEKTYPLSTSTKPTDPLEAKIAFQKNWQETYGNRPQKTTIETELDKRNKVLQLEDERRAYVESKAGKDPKSFSQKDINEYNAKVIKAGKEFDAKSQPPTDPLEALKAEARKYKSAEEFIRSRQPNKVTFTSAKNNPGYMGGHEAPMAEDINAPIWDLTGKYTGNNLYPEDIYSGQASKLYSAGEPFDQEAISILQSIKNRPNAKVTIYRAVSKEHPSKINPGDWVTLVRDYAKEHGESNLGGNYKIIKQEVSARDIFTDANSIHEFGYDPQPRLSPENTPYDLLSKAYKEGKIDKHSTYQKQLTDIYNQSQLPKSKVKVEANQPGKLMEANRLDNQALQVDNLTGKSPLVKPLQEQQVPSQSALSPQDLVNTSAKANQLPQTKSQLTKVNQQPGKPTKSQSQPYFNTKNMLISKKAKKVIDKTIAEVKPQIEKATGKKLTNKEVIEKANQSAKVLEGAVGKDQTLAWEASLLKARQKLAALSERGVVDQEYIDALVTVKTYGTDIARKLQSFGIGAEAELVTSKQAILEAVLKATDDADAVIKASKGVDFNDLKQATTFYRKFVKPTSGEWIDLIRYNSMLSSPNTHINNAFSNAQGTGLIAPIEKTVEGSLDALRSAITGKPRTIFAGEGVRYAKGYYSNIGTAAKRFVDVMRGKQQIKNPDMRHIRLATAGKGAKAESVLNYPMRLLEAADQFFSAMTEGGAKQALEYRAGKMGKPITDLEAVAQKEAAERLFRSELGDNQGSIALDAIDTVANNVQGLKNSKNPIVSTMAKFTLPFLRTPTNLLKQGVEFSPVGLVTLPGAKNKQQLIARSIMGSSIALGTSMLLGSDRLTWAEPTGEKQRNAYRAAGLQPYSVKIGNNWVSYSKLHPAISFNFALVAALKDSHDKGDIDDTQLDTILGGLAKWMNFYADQSYMKNIGDIVSATKGDVYGLSKMVSNYPQQLIPFRALMGWINRIIEPYQRQVNSDAGMLEKQFQYMATQIPGLSGIVPLRMSPDGQPIENQNRLLNAISPLRVTTQVKDYARPTKGVSLTSATGSAPVSIPTDQETFNELYKKALSNGKGFPMEKTLIEADPTLTEDEKVEKIAKLREKTAQWAETLITMQDKYPKQVFGAELKTYGKNSSYSVEERAGWVEKNLKTVKDEAELQNMLNQMWDSGVLTTGKTGTAQALIDRGLNVYALGNKVGSGQSKKTGGKSSKGKKVKLASTPKMNSVQVRARRSSFKPIQIKVKKLATPSIRIASAKRPSVNLLEARKRLQSLTKMPAYSTV